MAFGISVMVKALNIKEMHVDRVEYVQGQAFMNHEKYDCDHIEVHARPYKRIMGCCPICGKHCSIYDHKAKEDVSWQANSLNGVPVVILYQPFPVHPMRIISERTLISLALNCLRMKCRRYGASMSREDMKAGNNQN